MTRRLRQAIVFSAILAALAPAVTTSAQPGDDWSVKRDPFDKRVVARYKAILAKHPDDSGALAKLVAMYRRYRSVAKLVGEYEGVLAKKPDSFADNAVLGYLHLREGAGDKALPYFQKAAALRPTDAGVQLALGDLLRNAGKPDGAKTAYDAALAATKNKKLKVKALRALADLALGANDIATARKYYDQYLAIEPHNHQVRIELGDALLNHGKALDAVEVYKQAESRLKSDPARRVEVVARIGQAYEKAGQDDAAVREYRRAMSLVGRTYYLRRELTARIIEIYRKRQGLSDLLAEYEKEWPKKRRDFFEWDTLARLYEETGDQEKAIAAYEAATRKSPYELDTQRRLISMLENSGREKEALAQYEKVIRIAPGEPRFQLELAERYWNRGDQKKALELLAKMEKRFPGDASVFSAIAEMYTRWGKEDRALKAYERLVSIEPDESSHLVDLGEQYYQRNDKKKAIATWKRIVTRRTAANYARLGEVYAEHDLRDDAREMYTKAVQMAPKNPDFRKGRARVYERLRLWQPAIDDWNAVLALTANDKTQKPLRAEARRYIVGVYARWGRTQLSNQMRNWRTAFAADPPDVDAGRLLVEAHLKQHNDHQAAEVLKKLITIDGSDTDAMQELVKVYRRQRKFDDAVALLLDLVKLSPGREREFYTRIAEIKTDAREDDQAILYVQKALEKSPNDPVAHMRLAERYEAMQDEHSLEKAMAAYEKTIELDPRNFTAYFKLARLYQRENQTHMKAAKLYRTILERATDNEVLENAGHKAINLEELTGTLGELEKVVSPLAFTFSHKTVYRRILVELYGRYVPTLVARVHAGGDDGAAAEAELLRLGKRGLKPLLEALGDDQYPGQQLIAVSVLGHLGNKGAAAPLVHLALKPINGPTTAIGTLRPVVDIDTRVDALVAAGRLGDPRIIPELIELSRLPERSMREAAIFGLGRTGDARAVPPLMAALGDYNESVQAQACLGLSFSRDKQVVDRMIEVVADATRKDTTRAACAWALGVIGDGRALAPLATALAQGNDETQRLAAYALGRLADGRAVPALLAANFSRHEEIRRTVAWALARISAPKSVPAPVEQPDFLTRNDSFDADGTIRLLGTDLGDPTLAPGLLVGHEVELLAGIREALERHTDLQLRMLMVLDGHPGRIDLGALTDHLDQAGGGQKKKIVALLDRVGQALAPDLLRLTKHEDSKVRALALSVLAKADASQAIDALETGMTDSSPAVRRAVMKTATRYAQHHPEASAALAKAVAARLSAKGWLERTDAARALGGLGKAAPVDALITALDDDFGYVREAAARSLGAIGDPRAAGALQRATDDRDPKVAAAARKSLQQIRKK